MVLQSSKSFYFVRHAETVWTDDQIAVEATDISITPKGRQQAESIQNLVQNLDIHAICHSPLTRAKETTTIITNGALFNTVEVVDLQECTFKVWHAMLLLEGDEEMTPEGDVALFMNSAVCGVNSALKHPGTVLLVSHGGVFWALCYLLGISCDWYLTHCHVVQFVCDEAGIWKVEHIGE